MLPNSNAWLRSPCRPRHSRIEGPAAGPGPHRDQRPRCYFGMDPRPGGTNAWVWHPAGDMGEAVPNAASSFWDAYVIALRPSHTPGRRRPATSSSCGSCPYRLDDAACAAVPAFWAPRHRFAWPSFWDTSAQAAMSDALDRSEALAGRRWQARAVTVDGLWPSLTVYFHDGARRAPHLRTVFGGTASKL